MAATEHTVAEALQHLLDPNLDDPDDDSFYLMVQEVASYADAGVLTRDAGFILRLSDRTEYQITIVRSR
jgi:hypothetical protein